ncbi:hypothetical protein BY996DRAFT_2366006 [Phakopsora pachyrhizi]|nr:hypothetical protein BY996DRAFT_2366006 [Phakopsora pachyrhizi]
MKAFFSVKKKFGCGLQKVLGKTNKPESKAWDWDVGKVSTLARDLDNYIKTQIPINVKWKPENQSAEDLIINARLNGGALSLQISIHRLLIQTNPTEILTCLSASSALLDILEYVRCRGLLEETSSWSTYMSKCLGQCSSVH